MAAIPKPEKKIELFSGTYFGACTLGGIIGNALLPTTQSSSILTYPPLPACGPTHTAVTPLDLVKCRRQVDPKIYSSNLQAWRTIASKEGMRGIFFGWAPTFIGYSFQGAGKYGAYEVFKYYYGEKLFPNSPKTIVYLGASATAEFIADMFLCPFEAIKVRMQTTLPPYANNLREGWNKVVSQEGFGGLYKGLYPLWARQIPYTMVKFATFESAVAQIYATLGKPKEAYNTLQQTGVSFLGGYIAGIGCAVISHPADVMVSKLNADRKSGEGAGQAIGRIYRNIGFAGLWNGLPVRIAMIGTLTAFQWLIYDSFKVYLGVSGFVHLGLEYGVLLTVPTASDYWRSLDGLLENDEHVRLSLRVLREPRRSAAHWIFRTSRGNNVHEGHLYIDRDRLQGVMLDFAMLRFCPCPVLYATLKNTASFPSNRPMRREHRSAVR